MWNSWTSVSQTVTYGNSKTEIRQAEKRENGKGSRHKKKKRAQKIEAGTKKRRA